MDQLPGEIRLFLETDRQMLFAENGRYRKRKIRKDAEEFILAEAKELGPKTPITVILSLPAREAAGGDRRFAEAIQAHFAYRRSQSKREEKRTLQYGWRMLLIAFVVLGIALSGSQLLRDVFPHNSLAGTAVESLTILGWVAFWKPVELLLYAWYPFYRDRALYRRLQQSEVQVVSRQEGPGQDT